MAVPVDARPLRLEQAGADTLVIHWSSGQRCHYAVRTLRLACPCAGCVDEWTNERLLDPASVAADVHPDKIVPVGLYALSFEWSDGHSTGIYTFERLAEMCAEPQPQEPVS